MRSFLLVLAVFGAIGSVLGVCFGLLQKFHPAFDSFSHFRLHFIVLLMLSCGVLAILESGKSRILAVVTVVVGIIWVGLQTQKGPPGMSARGDLRLVQFNLSYDNSAIERVGPALSGYDADIITIQEVPPNHEAVLRELTAYPHQTHCFFRHRIGGVSILSKHALTNIDCVKGEGLVTAYVDLPGGAVTIGTIHAYWPWPFSQHAQVDKWASRLERLSGPVILAGDFNAAPWSHSVEEVAIASNTKVVPGLRMTIGVKALPPLPAVPIPIDHILLSQDLCAASARVMPSVGSDHYPVLVEINRATTHPDTGCAF